MNINKAQLASVLADRLEMSQKDADEAIKVVFASIFETVAKGGKVSMPGIGSFSLAERAARSGRNPKTGETIQIPASKSVKFKAAKNVNDAL